MRNLILAVCVSVSVSFAAEQACCASPAPNCTPVCSTKVVANSDTAVKKDQKDLPVISVAELAKNDGKNGHKAYIAVDGIVYDVSNIAAWKNGQHNGFSAGNDLSKGILTSPHGKAVLAKLTAVARLKEEKK